MWVGASLALAALTVGWHLAGAWGLAAAAAFLCWMARS